MKLLRICFPAIFLLSFFSCRKFVENQKEKAAISFITGGQWKIESYLVDSTSVTNEFDGYTFKFNDNGTVNGINGSQSQQGTWLGNVTDYSITSQFPSGAPLNRLNGKWIIKDSGLTYVKADREADSATMHLHLVKLP